MAELTGTLISHITSFEGSLGKKATWGLIDGDINNQEDLIQKLDLKAAASSLNEHIEDNNNPHNVTKAQLGLSNVDNTSDINKPISNATQLALNQKVSNVKVNGQSVVEGGVANVNVPTLTSDLTNDSGFITEADFPHNVKDGDNNSIHQINANSLGQDSVALGTSTAGSKAFSVSQLKSDKKTFVFGSTTGIEVGMQGNLYIYDGSIDTNIMLFGKVESINGNEVTFNNTVSWSGGLSLQNSYIWFTNHPELGNVIIGSGAVAEGYNTNATQVGSHSEGINTVALGKYSHAEGNGSIAGGYCSHAEGRNTKTTGLYAHSGGDGSEASGDYSFAHGLANKATNRCASAFNERTQANGRASSAFGYNCEANGTTSFVGGTNSKANHDSSFAFGTRTKTSRNNQAVFGKDNQDNSDALFIIGDGANENNKHNAFEVLANDVKSNGISLERKSNKVTSIDDTSTNTQYPSAKAVYDKVLPVEIATNDLQTQIDLKADDDDVVHKTGNEQISGNKRFNDLLYFKSSTKGGYYKFDKEGLTYTKNSVPNLIHYPIVSDEDTLLTEKNAEYSVLENQVVRNIVSDYGTYPRLFKYNSTKNIIVLDDRYRIMTSGVIGSAKYYSQRTYESDTSRGITINELANAFGILSPENNGRWIVFYRCHGIQTITTNKGNSYTIPYYSIRAKVSKTDGSFNYQSRGTIIFECPTNSSWIEDNNNNVYTDNAYVSCWEPFVKCVDVEGTKELVMFYSLIICNDGVYKVIDNGQTASKPSNSYQNINKIFVYVSGETITYNNNEIVLEGKTQISENGQVNEHSKVGMVSLVNLTNNDGDDFYSDTYLGVVENNVNQILSSPINLNVQIFQMDDIAFAGSQALITNNKSILLPNTSESRGAPYITKLDDGRIMISFMSSQEFKGQKRTDTNENNRIFLVYVSKIPITDISQIDDDMFVKVNFFNFGKSQYGKWGSVKNIDGTIYKAFTFGKNTGNTLSSRYGNVIISNK